MLAGLWLKANCNGVNKYQHAARPFMYTLMICHETPSFPIVILPSHQLRLRGQRDNHLPKVHYVAVAAFKGSIGEADITGECLGNPELQELADRVRLEADPAMSAAFPAEWPADIRVETTDGRAFERHVAYPKGEPEAPMSQTEVEAKFLSLAAEAMPETRARAVIDAVAGLDKAPDLGPLCELLRG